MALNADCNGSMTHLLNADVLLLDQLCRFGRRALVLLADDVRGLPDEERAVADAREARDVLDHLGVVVRGQVGLAVAALAWVRHTRPERRAGLQLALGGVVVVLYQAISIPEPNEDFESQTTFVYYRDGDQEPPGRCNHERLQRRG